MPGRVLASCALSLGILPLAACQSAAPGLTEADRTAIQQSHDAFAKRGQRQGLRDAGVEWTWMVAATSRTRAATTR